MRSILGGLALSLALVAPAGAQGTSASPSADALRANLKRSETNFVAAADFMPAEKYGFKPTAQQMPFGQLVLHAVMANDFMCGTISGTKAPARTKLTPTSPKADLMAQLKASYSFCHTALAPLTDADLGAQLPYFGGRTITRAGAEQDLVADWADHYSMAAMYLRLNGILPPTARGRGGD